MRGATARHARAEQCIRRAWAPVEHPEAGLAVSWPCFRSRRYERLLDMSTTHDQRHARSGAAGATASQYTSLRAWQLFGEADPSPHARGQPCILGAAHARIFATPPCPARPGRMVRHGAGACDRVVNVRRPSVRAAPGGRRLLRLDLQKLRRVHPSAKHSATRRARRGPCAPLVRPARTPHPRAPPRNE